MGTAHLQQQVAKINQFDRINLDLVIFSRNRYTVGVHGMLFFCVRLYDVRQDSTPLKVLGLWQFY